MDKRIREAQIKILDIFSKEAERFALAGGTALELYYLHHRFSADLDFFSPVYDLREIENLISSFGKFFKRKIKLQAEFVSSGKARVRFYSVPIRGSRPLKLDFLEDNLFAKPKINKFGAIRVYSAQNLYLQKITAVTGVGVEIDEIGREIMQGRREARDIFDIYMLSKKIQPLHLFLKKIPRQMQRGIIHWYRTFSRQDLMLSLLDLEIYDKDFNGKDMVIYLEDEIKEFIKEVAV